MDIYQVTNARGVFCDAAVVDDDNTLVFASLWGRDTAIQGLLGSLTLASSEGGTTHLRLACTDTEQALPKHFAEPGMWIRDADALDKTTGRVSRAATVHGTMIHLFLYRKELVRPTGRSSIVLSRSSSSTEEQSNALWTTTKDLSSHPMLDSWMDPILAHLVGTTGQIKPLSALGVTAWRVDLTEEAQISDWLTQSVRSHALPVFGL